MKIFKNDIITLKPEWMDKGDENVTFYAVEDMEGNSFYASVKEQEGMAIQPRYLIRANMVEAVNPKPALVMATFETRNFEFVAFGDTENECISLLGQAWAKHCRDYKHADSDYFIENVDGVNFTTVIKGAVYRDDDRLL